MIKRFLGLAVLLALATAPVTSFAVPPASLPAPSPVISAPGGAIVGQVLSVPAYAGATYQWLRNGSTIAGAASAAYTLASPDGGTTVSVRVTLAGVSVTSGGVPVGMLDYSAASQSGLLTLTN